MESSLQPGEGAGGGVRAEGDASHVRWGRIGWPRRRVKAEIAEATGVGSASSIVRGAGVRVPVPDFRPASDFNPRWPSRSRPDDPAPRRYRQRPRKLTPAEEAAIRALAATRSLRALAADFGVSHETVRAVLREPRLAREAARSAS